MFSVEYNTAATVIGSFGISLGTVVMNKVSIWAADSFGWRYRFIVCGQFYPIALFPPIYLFLYSAIMQATCSLPAVILWGQPYEPKKENEEPQKKKEDEATEETELITTGSPPEEQEKFNLFTDISFWCWLWGTTFWSLGESLISHLKKIIIIIRLCDSS